MGQNDRDCGEANGVITMQKDKVSIIVPAYNAEKTIERCIESCLKQTYSSYEIIIIDDGSTDNTAKICNEYAQKYLNIRYLHQQNAGAAAARNYGLDVSDGEFVTFCDADDILLSEYVEYLVSLLKKNEVDISVCSYVKAFEEKEVKKTEADYKIYSSQCAMELFFYRKGITGYPHCKMYRKKIIGDIRFKTEYRLGEDFIFVYELLKTVSSVVISKKELYIYTQNFASITHTLRLEDKVKLWKYYESILENNANSVQRKKALISLMFIKSVDFSIVDKKELKNNGNKIFLQFATNNSKIILWDSQNKLIIRFLALCWMINSKLTLYLATIVKKINGKLLVFKKAI